MNIIKHSISNKFSIIQGPPGCGKSTIIISIVDNWLRCLKKNFGEKILVCAPSNTAVDMLANLFMKIPSI